jgi:hypothetical protein
LSQGQRRETISSSEVEKPKVFNLKLSDGFHLRNFAQFFSFIVIFGFYVNLLYQVKHFLSGLEYLKVEITVERAVFYPLQPRTAEVRPPTVQSVFTFRNIFFEHPLQSINISE